MNVKILDLKSGELINALIRKGIESEMPSMQSGWRFNFNQHFKGKNKETFVLVRKDSPTVIEGCLIFEMKDGIVPYMKFIESAPHNQGLEKKHDYVVGCLIAFACDLSNIKGKAHYEGFLAFDVMEQDKKDEIKLMEVYSMKYKAMLDYPPGTGMLIPPKRGQELILEYLKR